MRKRSFLATQFLSYNDHLQLIVFLHPWMLSNKLHELQKMQFTIYIWPHFNATMSQQLFFNYYANSPMTTTIMSSHHFSSIHQNLTHGTMRIFLWFFSKYWYPSSIMILHFRRSCIMTYGTIKSCHVTLIEFWKQYVYMYYLGR
jgi:hypothetical protein